MLEYAWYMLTSIIGSISGGILTLAIVKHMSKTEKLTEKLEEITTAFLSKAENQKKIYMLGALIGNGAKSGIGLSGKGKFKWEDLAMQVLGSYFKVGGQQQEGGNQFGDNTIAAPR